MNGQEWTNWSGSVRFHPARVEQPADDEAVAAVVARASDERRHVRAVGSLHSSSSILPAEDVLVSLERLAGVESVDTARSQAWVKAGTTLHDLGQMLLRYGLALPNLGDIDLQTVAGAFSTGTHGTGQQFKIVADPLIGVRLVSGEGKLEEYSEDSDPAVIRAARVSLGALGLFTAVKLQLIRVLQLRLRQWCTHVDDCLAHLDELIASHRHFDFYWYPRRDETKLRTWNPPGDGPADLPFALCISDETDWSTQLLPRHRHIDRKFEEMEYALPAAAGPECFQEVRRRVKERHRRLVCWRVLYRTVAGDEAFLSPPHGRPTVTISLHQNASLPYWDYFHDLEPVFLAYGGRPHWGKKYTIGREQLRTLYPQWESYCQVRERLDPRGLFLNDHLRELFAPHS